VDAIKHSLAYSGGLSRSYVRTYAPAAALGFDAFSPFTTRSVIASAVAIPFEQVLAGDAGRLNTLKQEVVSARHQGDTGDRHARQPEAPFSGWGIGHAARAGLEGLVPPDVQRALAGSSARRPTRSIDDRGMRRSFPSRSGECDAWEVHDHGSGRGGGGVHRFLMAVLGGVVVLATFVGAAVTLVAVPWLWFNGSRPCGGKVLAAWGVYSAFYLVVSTGIALLESRSVEPRALGQDVCADSGCFAVDKVDKTISGAETLYILSWRLASRDAQQTTRFPGKGLELYLFDERAVRSDYRRRPIQIRWTSRWQLASRYANR
jgi:hypothetical protein